MKLTGLLALIVVSLCFAGPLAAASVSDDWLESPNQSNTADDTWQFFYDIDSANRDGTYTRLEVYNNSLFAAGVPAWQAMTVDAFGVPLVGINLSGVDVDSQGPSHDSFIPAGSVFLHPAQSVTGGVGIGFLVPQSGVYDIMGSVTDADVFGNGDGIAWYLDVNDASGNLRVGQFPNGGGDDFCASHVMLESGDVVNLIVDRRASFANDLTNISFGVVLHTQDTPGDANFDCKVDGLDYLIWAENFGDDPADDPPGSPENGDFDDDGKVDGLDYLLWASNFGQGPNDATTVPEPTTLMLAVMGAMTLLSRQTPSRRRIYR